MRKKRNRERKRNTGRMERRKEEIGKRGYNKGRYNLNEKGKGG